MKLKDIDYFYAMKAFIEYLLLFGNLNQQQIDFISQKAVEKALHKDEYFAEAGKILKHVAFIIEGVLRICYYNNQGEEITRYFLDENHLIFSFKDEPISEYVQAATDCRLLVFSNKDWKEIENTIVGWEAIFQKIVNKTLAEKLDRRSPLIEQDATTRYLMFLEKFPALHHHTSRLDISLGKEVLSYIFIKSVIEAPHSIIGFVSTFAIESFLTIFLFSVLTLYRLAWERQKQQSDQIDRLKYIWESEECQQVW